MGLNVPPLIPALLACFFSIGFAHPPAARTSGFVQVEPSSRQFVDANGRSVLFHGSSVVYKVSRCVSPAPSMTC
jgi:hypothetical protein